MLYFMNMCSCHFQHQIQKSQMEPFLAFGSPKLGCYRSRICSLKRKSSENKMKASTSLTSSSALLLNWLFFIHVCNVYVFVNKRSCKDSLCKGDPVWRVTLSTAYIKWLVLQTCYTFLETIRLSLLRDCCCCCVRFHVCLCSICYEFFILFQMHWVVNCSFQPSFYTEENGNFLL